jgi:hypothetical protein
MYDYPIEETYTTARSIPVEYRCYCDMSGTVLSGTKCRRCNWLKWCKKRRYHENAIVKLITKISRAMMRNKTFYHIVWSVLGPYDIKKSQKGG